MWADLIAKLLGAYAAEPDSVEVEVVLCGPGEQEPMLRDGRADVALLHRPYDVLDGLEVEDLVSEGQVVVLPAGHDLTVRPHLTLAEVAAIPGLPLPRWPDRDGRYPEGPGAEVHDVTQILQLVALGRAAVVLPDSVRAQLTDDLRVVPVVDAEPVTTLIAWPRHSRSPAVAGLVRTAVRL